LHNQISTDNTFAAVFEKLNRQSQKLFLQQAMGALESHINQVNQDSINRDTALSESVNTEFARIETIRNEIAAAADILSNFEQGQVEEAFAKLLQTSSLAALISDICIQVGGVGYRLGSVVEALAQADVDAEIAWEMTPDNTEIAAVSYTLTDGFVVRMPAEYSLDEATGVKSCVFSTPDGWRGAAAQFTHEFLRIRTEHTIAGQVISQTEWEPIRQTQLVFDLTALLTTCEEFTAEVPDLNQDGVVGNLDPNG
jgi:hypothetical protein